MDAGTYTRGTGTGTYTREAIEGTTKKATEKALMDAWLHVTKNSSKEDMKSILSVLKFPIGSCDETVIKNCSFEEDVKDLQDITRILTMLKSDKNFISKDESKNMSEDKPEDMNEDKDGKEFMDGLNDFLKNLKPVKKPVKKPIEKDSAEPRPKLIPCDPCKPNKPIRKRAHMFIESEDNVNGLWESLVSELEYIENFVNTATSNEAIKFLEALKKFNSENVFKCDGAS